MDLKTLENFKETKNQRLKVAQEFQKSHFQYTTTNSKAEEYYLPQSSHHDYSSINKNDIKLIKATTFANLKQNSVRGVKTHWALSNRKESNFPSVRGKIEPKLNFDKDSLNHVFINKKDISKEHFTLGNSPSHFNTTNMELLVPLTQNNGGVNTNNQNSKIK